MLILYRNADVRIAINLFVQKSHVTKKIPLWGETDCRPVHSITGVKFEIVEDNEKCETFSVPSTEQGRLWIKELSLLTSGKKEEHQKLALVREISKNVTGFTKRNVLMAIRSNI
jgi:hypothetical protein